MINANPYSHIDDLMKKLKEPECDDNNMTLKPNNADAINVITQFCLEQRIPFRIINLHASVTMEQERIEHILKETRQHERYRILLRHIPIKGIHTPAFIAALLTLEFITQYSMFEPKRNITIIQNAANTMQINWFYALYSELSKLNRFCSGSLIFI